MYWEVIVPGDGDGALSASVTVEAENWFSALRNGLSKKGYGPQLVSNLTCDVKPDKSVLVTDFVTRKVYTLVPLGDQLPAAEAEPASEPSVPGPRPTPASGPVPFAKTPSVAPPPGQEAAAVSAPTVEGTPEHKLFFSRDESPDDGSGIFYRERLLSVAPGTDKDAAAQLAMAYFHQLKSMGSAQGTRLFITVQVFDHDFDRRSARPAIAALSWKEWSPKKAKLQFPLSGDDGIRLSRVPQPPAARPVQPEQPVRPAQPAPMPEPVGSEAVLSELISQSAPTQEPSPEPVPLTKRAAPEPAPQVQPAPASAPEPRVQAQPAPEPKPVPLVPRTDDRAVPQEEEIDVDDAIVKAFERMQDIYSVRDHDMAALFALELSREFIRCEAGSTMLITPGKYELYVAAAQGDVADKIMGKKLSLTKGIVGFATRAGAVITVSDPDNDPRFHDEFDKLSGFATRNILCAPIQYEGKTIGAIELINSPRKAGFLQTEANVLSYIAGAVGEYIDTSLPSREADFSDKEFMEFLPQKKGQPQRRPGPRRKKKVSGTGRPAPAAKKKSDEVKQTLAGTPKAKKAATGSSSPAKKKKKKKRKR